MSPINKGVINMVWYSKSTREVLDSLKTDSSGGLSDSEAAARLIKYGVNSIDNGGKREGFLKRLLRQFNDFLVIILISASAVSFAVSYIKGDGDYIDSIIILGIVAVNAVLGVIQEDKAEKAINELKKLTINKARIIRNGKMVFTDSDKAVPGDIILLEAGDVVCADARLLDSEGLACEESSLTGESVP